MQIKKVSAKSIKDSRNQLTIEVSVNGCKASSPAGKSTGIYETPSYHESLKWNISFINNAKFNISINSFSDLKKIESFIRMELNISDAKQFGANALFALESAILKSLAKSHKKELWQILNAKAKSFPRPLGNIIGGGLHSHAKNSPVFQEFLISPRSKSPKENNITLNKIYADVKKKLKAEKVNDEGALETSLGEETILSKLNEYSDKIDVGVDIAASSFYDSELQEYVYHDQRRTKEQQIAFVNSLIEQYNLLYVEDPLHEEDFEGFSKIGKKNLVVGDDLTATHLSRLKEALKNKSINAIIVKPNQNGSLLEVKDLIDFCKKKGIKTILSHRSGETMDDSIADYAFAFQCDFIKCGIATKWGEAKLNRLAEIEKQMKRVF